MQGGEKVSFELDQEAVLIHLTDDLGSAQLLEIRIPLLGDQFLGRAEAPALRLGVAILEEEQIQAVLSG